MKTLALVGRSFIAGSSIFNRNNHFHTTSAAALSMSASTVVSFFHFFSSFVLLLFVVKRIACLSYTAKNKIKSNISRVRVIQESRLGIDYPELVVFDLDACLWDQEMFEMGALPSKTVTGDLNGK